jgi:hypothetical protein
MSLETRLTLLACGALLAGAGTGCDGKTAVGTLGSGGAVVAGTGGQSGSGGGAGGAGSGGRGTGGAGGAGGDAVVACEAGGNCPDASADVAGSDAPPALASCTGEGDPSCGAGSACIVGCPRAATGGLCRVAGRETCGCGGVDQPCTTPGLTCLYPSCCDFMGLCLTPAERQAVCSGPLAAQFDCARGDAGGR